MANARRALLLGLGGTISMTGAQGRGVSPTLGSHDLVAGIAGAITVEPRDLRTAPGAHLSFADVLDAAAMIRSAAADGFDGVVVTQGTDTIEETAFALDLLVGDDITVVVTGAMRNASAPGADGPANVSDALAVAVDRTCRGIGTLVVMNGEVHAASLVRKAHSVSPSAFESHPGALGWVSEGVPTLLLLPCARQSVPRTEPPWPQRLPRVEMISAVLDADASMLDRLREDLPDALVVQAFGAGHLSPSFVAPLEAIAMDRPVVLCSRTRRGPILSATYDFAGSESDLLDRGLIRGGHLDGPKARIALVLLLLSGSDQGSVRAFFG